MEPLEVNMDVKKKGLQSVSRKSSAVNDSSVLIPYTATNDIFDD